MRDFDEHTITNAVLERFSSTPNARLNTILDSLVRHVHDFIRDVEPSFEEWSTAVDFLTRTGQICTSKRQEFILLSDTLGISMLVDAINHRMPAGATETTVLGPFYVQHAPEMPAGADISAGMQGEPLYTCGVVRSANGHPLSDAIIDVWQADDHGYYDVQQQDLEGELALRARFRTDKDGRYYFRSIVPSFYPIPDDGPVGEMLKATKRHPNRPAHIHFMVQAPGHETLVTHIFLEGSPYLESDAVFGVKTSLIAALEPQPAGTTETGIHFSSAYQRLNYSFGLKPAH
jgi:hydroxyquinol 1,2-dioxygenase